MDKCSQPPPGERPILHAVQAQLLDLSHESSEPGLDENNDNGIMQQATVLLTDDWMMHLREPVRTSCCSSTCLVKLGCCAPAGMGDLRTPDRPERI